MAARDAQVDRIVLLQVDQVRGIHPATEYDIPVDFAAEGNVWIAEHIKANPPGGEPFFISLGKIARDCLIDNIGLGGDRFPQRIIS